MLIQRGGLKPWIKWIKYCVAEKSDDAADQRKLPGQWKVVIQSTQSISRVLLLNKKFIKAQAFDKRIPCHPQDKQP